MKPDQTVSNFEALEAHGTGTALGDPIEVGAAVAALCQVQMLTNVACTSLKANMGHLETAAAAAGLMSVFVVPLNLGHVAPNALLRGLNSHLTTLVSSHADCQHTIFLLHAELSAGYNVKAKKDGFSPGDKRQFVTARLSSFGFSGTIAHA